MNSILYITDESDVKVWGLTPGERVGKILGKRAAVIDDPEEIPENAAVMVVRGDFLLDDRLIKYLAETPGIIIVKSIGGRDIPFAAHVSSEEAVKTVEFIKSRGTSPPPGQARIRDMENLSVSFSTKLRKFEPPFVYKVRQGDEERLERQLFNWSYKGVTDLVTKWLWPAPARRVVRKCVELGIRPNHVTTVSFILVIVAGWLFAEGHLWAGLAAGWLMTFLDTVDGKLARVTVTSSRFGHYFDHLIDLIHPPLWYLLWGTGLQSAGRYYLDVSLSTLMWWIFTAYIAGRLVELIFKKILGDFGIFCWRPVDSFFRLVTARRNPCIIILTASLLAGRPDLGLLAVTWWTVLTTMFLIARLAWGFILRFRGEKLESWFNEIDRRDRNRLAVRWFTRDIRYD